MSSARDMELSVPEMSPEQSLEIRQTAVDVATVAIAVFDNLADAIIETVSEVATNALEKDDVTEGTKEGYRLVLQNATAIRAYLKTKQTEFTAHVNLLANCEQLALASLTQFCSTFGAACESGLTHVRAAAELEQDTELADTNLNDALAALLNCTEPSKDSVEAFWSDCLVPLMKGFLRRFMERITEPGFHALEISEDDGVSELKPAEKLPLSRFLLETASTVAAIYKDNTDATDEVTKE